MVLFHCVLLLMYVYMKKVGYQNHLKGSSSADWD